MNTDQELRIQNAIADFGSGISMTAAAAAWNVQRSTLSRRLNGSVNHRIASSGQQRLSPIQEDFLKEWIIYEEVSGRAPSKATVRSFANKILSVGDDERGVGKRWIYAFLDRNPDVSIKPGRRINV